MTTHLYLIAIVCMMGFEKYAPALLLFLLMIGSIIFSY